MTLVARFFIIAAAACLAACSSVTRTPPPEAPKVAAQAPQPAATPPAESPPRSVAREEQPAPPAAKAHQPPPAPAAKAPVAPKPATPSKTAKAPPPKAPTAAATTPAAKPPPAAEAVAPKPAPLDLKTLEERLKDTSAIGVMTKLSLKNQVDDLVGRFRAYHDGRRPPTLAELRPGFELLLMKVLSLLQDKDTALAHDINASRDAIWSVLADKQKFAEFS